MKRKRKERDYPQKFRGAGDEWWWYEDRRGIDIYHHVLGGSPDISGVRLSWGVLARAMGRCKP